MGVRDETSGKSSGFFCSFGRATWCYATKKSGKIRRSRYRNRIIHNPTAS